MISKENNELLLISILDNIPEVIFLIDLNYICRYVNKQGLAFLNRDIEDVIGCSINDIFPPDVSIENMRGIKHVIDTGESKTFAERSFHVNKGVVWLETRIIPVKDELNKVTGILGISQDVTNRKQKEEELLKNDVEVKKAQKLESLGILAGGIAHDFNNLLGGMLGYLENAKKHSSDKIRVEENLCKATEVLNSAKNLANQILTFSKGGSPNTKTVDMKQMLKKTGELSNGCANVKVISEVAENLKNCDIDEIQIRQVFDNVILNARQAMSKGGTLKISAKNINSKEGIPSELETNKDYIKITISDTGAGIPPEIMPKIFDPFFSTKKHGGGLGLSTAFSIVKRHMGAIEAESSVPFGTSIHIYLPSKDSVVDINETPVMDNQFGTGNILVMDDEVFILEMLEDILKEIGYKVSAVERSDDALEIFKNALPFKNKFNIVILDLTIPGGMGGKEIVKRMKELDPKIKAIASSGYSDDEIMSRPKDFGFDASLAKPYSIEALAEVLKVLSAKERNG